MAYRFNKEKHLHQIEVEGVWKNLTGCTTVLNVVAKPNLIQWAADMAVGNFGWIKAHEWQEVNGKLKKIAVPKDKRLKLAMEGLKKITVMDQERFLEALDAARVAHSKRKERSGTYGTRTHDEISKVIIDGMQNNDGHVRPEEATSENVSVKNFVSWASKNMVRFLETEKNIYSERLWIGGIVDFVCEIDGKVWIGDIKTSGSGIYPENFWQMAGYHLMLTDMGFYPQVAGYLVLNLKENGEMLEKRSVSNEDNIKGFLACLDIYRLQEKLKVNVL